MNIRLLPPTIAAKQTITFNGRSYSSTPGNVVDIMDADALELEANSWIPVAPSGPTSARPTGQLGLYTATPGFLYFDTTISKLVVYDGAAWRDPSTGGAV
jgi:hypothetical protein